MNRFSLRVLRTFVTVAESGSIRLAAQKLGRSQAAVSATIAEFEQAMGIHVFLRKPAKGLTLTSVGETLSLEARGLLAHADEFDAIAGAMGSAFEGELTVGCFINLAPIVFANMVAEFRRAYPRINVQMVISDHETIMESLRRGTSELAVTFDLVVPEQFRSVTLASLPPRAMLPMSHPQASAHRVRLADLASEPLVLMDLPHTARNTSCRFSIRSISTRRSNFVPARSRRCEPWSATASVMRSSMSSRTPARPTTAARSSLFRLPKNCARSRSS